MPRWCHRLLNWGVRPISSECLSRSAIVFAPHQDDECLGCGGTILLKRRAGADVRIVFMTDGTSSHPAVPAEELAATRNGEAREAAKLLDVPAANVTFLDFRDGELAKHESAALERVAEILREVQPAEVFVPYQHDVTADHESTNRIVRRALERLRRDVVVYEYPIWFLYHWPWVKLPAGRGQDARRIIRNTLRGVFGVRALALFRDAFNVRDVLPQKAAALAAHRSQMQGPGLPGKWLTLHDVAGGSFLACFAREYESFRRYEVHGRHA